MLSDSVTRGDGGGFLGESLLRSQSGGLTVTEIYFSTQTLGELKFFPVTDAVFWAEM